MGKNVKNLIPYGTLFKNSGFSLRLIRHLLLLLLFIIYLTVYLQVHEDERHQAE
jgi:hypothetical protein